MNYLGCGIYVCESTNRKLIELESEFTPPVPNFFRTFSVIYLPAQKYLYLFCQSTLTNETRIQSRRYISPGNCAAFAKLITYFMPPAFIPRNIQNLNLRFAHRSLKNWSRPPAKRARDESLAQRRKIFRRARRRVEYRNNLSGPVATQARVSAALSGKLISQRVGLHFLRSRFLREPVHF